MFGVHPAALPSLLERLKNDANAVIEIVGPSGAGKRAISKAVVW